MRPKAKSEIVGESGDSWEISPGREFEEQVFSLTRRATRETLLPPGEYDVVLEEIRYEQGVEVGRRVVGGPVRVTVPYQPARGMIFPMDLLSSSFSSRTRPSIANRLRLNRLGGA